MDAKLAGPTHGGAVGQQAQLQARMDVAELAAASRRPGTTARLRTILSL
jgi:hypothetical protein